jgi:predicted Zn-dependent protease
MKTVLFRVLAGAVLLASVAGCYDVPVTGRRSLSLVDPQQVARMSVQAFEDMKRQHRVSTDPVRIAQLQRVGERISKVVFWDMPNADWEFVVFDEPEEINAFAMSGGKVGVFTGLFKVVKNDDQLAAVISHEIAHVTAKHIDERLSKEMLAETAGNIGGIAMAGTMGLVGTDVVMSAYGIGADARSLAFGRQQELEADHIGLIYMAKAGYDPQQAIEVMDNLAEATAGEPEPPEFESTHPSTPDRLRALQAEMPEALKAKASAATSSGQTSGIQVIK